MYEAQLNAYATIAEGIGYSPVLGLSLVYLEPKVGIGLGAGELTLPFEAIKREVELRPGLVRGLLRRAKELLSLEGPPAGRVETDRGCGSEAVYFTGETVQIDFFVEWMIWFQRVTMTVYDAQGNEVLRATGLLPPFLNGRGTRFLRLDDLRPRGRWRAVLYVNWGFGSHRLTCDFTVADAALSPPDSPTRFLQKGQSHLWQLQTVPGISYTAVLFCDAGNDFDLFLLDRNLNPIRSSVAFGCPDVITFTATDSSYYLRVVAASGSGWYGLRVF